MHGFPPAVENQVTLANWRTAPFNRWSFQHVREIVPSADIAHEPSATWSFEVAPVDVSSVKIDCGRAGILPLAAFHDYAHVDAMIALHGDNIVYEHYRHDMTSSTPHILMSVSKSLLGMLAAILEANGTLNSARLVTDYLPELTNTAYRGATVRHLLDMRAGIAFDEDYLATSGAIIDYRKATNWNPLETGDSESDLRSFFASLKANDGEHGGRFHYVSPNTDMLAWILERAADCRYSDLMSNHLWRPAGMETSAYITVDRLGAPRAAGGMCTTMRDLARIARLLIHDGVRNGTRILPAGFVDDIENKGDRDAWNNGDFAGELPGMPFSYRSKWYALHEDTTALIAIGIHGQNIYVDRARDFALVKFSSSPNAIDGSVMAHFVNTAKAVRDALTR